ncbi:MAG TPA: cell wall hydrolase [Clostridiales bacterium]|nr:cell wall hydrolase [Clostridiales bacterium]
MIMVAIAYLLSIFMLFIGSDVFYKTPRSAAGVNNITDESTEELITDENINTISDVSITQLAGPLEKPIEKVEELYILYPTVSNYMESQVIVDITDIAVSNSTETSVAEARDEISSFSVTSDTSLAKEKADVKEKAVKEEATPKYVIDISKEEITMLERIVQAEAGSEDLTGRVLVANVIINRTKDDEFPDSIEGVIFQNSDGEYQFSPISDKRYWSVKVKDKTKEAVKLALEGEDNSDGALFFMARKRARVSSARWFDNNLKWLFKHGGHEFFR